MIIYMMMVKTIKYTLIYQPEWFMTSYITCCQSSPVVQRKSIMKAIWKLLKLKLELMANPEVTS